LKSCEHINFLTGCKNNGFAVPVQGVYLCSNIFFPVTLILNMLLILLLVVLTGLYIHWRKQPGKTQIPRWILFPGLLFLIIALFRFLNVYKEEAATEPQSLSSVQSAAYSPGFTHAIENIFSSYFQLVDQLAAGNMATAEEQGSRLKLALDSFTIEELVTDTIKYDAVCLSLDNARAETTAIIMDPEIAEKRASLNILSRELYTMLTLLVMADLSYYRLICPDAFGKGNEGWWIGKSADAPNPYGLTGCSSAQRITKTDQPIIK
jgi:hypothetical protein